ncbi:hypothetical protein DPEC_G00062830 [Dallia pectoralis]|uniref:Uncharacterized protein n=1 Tax=Dallia pectoralis TaxID=75939 RepID=A0ACC2H877_DALPE|nr:hypothetical protein DPEC_G00062830 [Dallia pectoralis]
MYAKCLDSGIRARKEDVRIILAELDPVNSQARRRRRLNRRQYFSQGPNFIWHIDSYDKLKPYGICINGCIDGYSRKIVWLKSAYTSSDPRVIGSYFVGAMQELGGGPRLVRTDMGTENVVVRDIQRNLRSDGEDIWAGEKSFIAGASTANQRIESWWGVMRKEGVEYWIQLFGQLKDEGLFAGDFVDKALMQFCFMGTIQVRPRILSVKYLSVGILCPFLKLPCGALYRAYVRIKHHVNVCDSTEQQKRCTRNGVNLGRVPQLHELRTLQQQQLELRAPNITAVARAHSFSLIRGTSNHGGT